MAPFPMLDQPPSSSSAPARIFYGWYVVYALCLVSTVTSGLIFYNISVLLDAFVHERAFPTGLVSVASGLFFIASGSAGAIVGQWIDRIDARLVIIVSGCVTTLALCCIGLIREPWHLFVFYAAFGFCYGGCGLVSTSTIVARWFTVRRAQALAVASTGFSLGGILLTPLSAFLIKQLGLSDAAPWLAAILFLGVVPVAALVVRASPQSMGLAPEGAALAKGASTTLPGTPFAEARRSRFFIAVTGCYLFALGAQVGGIAHLYRLVNIRTDPEVAALGVALLAATSTAGRLAAGWVLAHVSTRRFTLCLIANQAIGLIFLAFAQTRGALIVAVVIFGVTNGSFLMMQQLLIAEAFGTREYGRIYSVSQLVSMLGLAGGPALVGLISDASGGYTVPFLVIAGATLIGGLILSVSGPTRR